MSSVIINGLKYRVVQLDRNQGFHVVQNDIRLLTAEIYKLSKLGYSERKNREKIIKLDDQIKYLEELLAAYERDHKKFE